MVAQKHCDLILHDLLWEESGIFIFFFCADRDTISEWWERCISTTQFHFQLLSAQPIFDKRT